MAQERPGQHPEQPKFPEITPADLAVTYILDSFLEDDQECQIDREGFLVLNGLLLREFRLRYLGIISSVERENIFNQFSHKDESGNMVCDRERCTPHFLQRALRIPFAQIQHHLSQGMAIIGQIQEEGFLKNLLFTSLIQGVKTANALPGGAEASPGRTEAGVQAQAASVLGGSQPESTEAQQIYALLEPIIRKAVTEGRFTQLHAAAVAKRLGYEKAVPLLLSLASPIDAASRASQMLRTCQTLISSDLVLAADLARILRKYKESELREYLGILEPQTPEPAKVDLKRAEAIKVFIERLQEIIAQTKEGCTFNSLLTNLHTMMSDPTQAVASYSGTERICLFFPSGPLGEYRFGVPLNEIPKLSNHSFGLPLKGGHKTLELSLFDLEKGGTVILEALFTFIRDVLYFGNGFLTCTQVESLLEPLAKALGQEAKIGKLARVGHLLRLAVLPPRGKYYRRHMLGLERGPFDLSKY